VVLAVVVLAGSAAVARGPSDAPTASEVAAARSAYVAPPEQPTAFFFGDSYFNGSDYTTVQESMAYLAGSSLGYQTFVSGAGGTGFTSARTEAPASPDYLGQIRTGGLKVDVGDVQVVVVEGGLNDRGKPSGQVTANARQVLAAAKEQYPDARLLLLGPVDPDGQPDPEVGAVVRSLAAAAKSEQVPFIDASGWFTPKQAATLIGKDGTHPTVQGHRVLAGKLEQTLRARGVPAV